MKCDKQAENFPKSAVKTVITYNMTIPKAPDGDETNYTFNMVSIDNL